MTCKKNEIRVVDDLELKNVSGASPFLVFIIIAGILTAVGIGANPPSKS